MRSSRGTEEIKVLVGYRRWAVAMTALLPSLWSFPSCFLASCYSWIGVAVIRQREQRHLKTTAPAFKVCGSSTWRTWCWKEKVREGNCFHHYYNCHCFFFILIINLRTVTTIIVLTFWATWKLLDDLRFCHLRYLRCKRLLLLSCLNHDDPFPVVWLTC